MSYLDNETTQSDIRTSGLAGVMETASTRMPENDVDFTLTEQMVYWPGCIDGLVLCYLERAIRCRSIWPTWRI